MKKWFIIEGNIGSGKTTLINKLKNNSNFEVFEEPVEVWRNIKGSNEQNLLGLFYEDPIRYSYLFQTIVFKTRLQSLDIIQQKNIRFSERSIWSDKYVFGKSCIENNKMNELEKNCYYQWFDWLEEKFNPIASGIIYVKTSPELCLERIQQRARGEENTIPLSYLKELDDRHNLWLENWTSTPVLIIDNNNENNIDINIDNINHWNNILDQINNFIL